MTTVVAGGGIAGFEVALGLERKGEKVILIEPREELVFYPSIHDLLVNQGKNCGIDYEEKFEGRKIEHLKDSMEGLEKENRKVILEQEESVKYDKLVLALGSVPFFRSVDVNSQIYSLRSKDKVEQLRNGVVNGDLEDLVVIGGGPTGVEATASLMEHVGDEELGLKLVNAEETLLPRNTSEMGEEAEEILGSHGVELILGEKVSSIGKSYIEMDSGERIKSDATVWAGGVKPHPLIEELDLACSKKGLKVGRDLKVEGEEDIYGTGDIVDYSGKKNRAYTALKESKTVYRNIIRGKKGKDTRKVGDGLSLQLVHLGRKYAGLQAGSSYFSGYIPFLIRKYMVEERYFLLRKYLL